MTRFSALLLLLPLVACHSRSGNSGSVTEAGSIATHSASPGSFALRDSAGRQIGQVRTTEIVSGVQLEISVTGLTPGAHGMHLHATGLCDPPAFTTASDHLNPASKQHGTKNPLGPHLGDLPNIVVDQQGAGRARVGVPGVTLKPDASPGAMSGTALVIHAGPDDERSDPAGNSGERIVCGVITILRSATP